LIESDDGLACMLLVELLVRFDHASRNPLHTDHFRAQEFEAQVYRTNENRAVMQARKESLWRQLLGVTYALTVVFTPGDGQLSIDLGGHEWVDAAVSGAIGLVAVPPVLLGTAYGIWKENKLDQKSGR
jgi:hypothetical protein